MSNILGIIGSILFVGAVVFGYFVKFDNADIVAIAMSAFALASIVASTVAKYKNAGKKIDWKFIVIVVATIVGAVLVCIGGLSENIFSVLAGAVIGILTVIFGIAVNKKTE